MQLHFPVYLYIASMRLHPHWLFETLAYLLAFQVYRRMRHGYGDAISDGVRWSVIAAAAVGAAVGSKILFWLEEPLLTLQNLRNLPFLLGGKSIVGGLAGGLIAVELVKRRMGVQTRTGDLFAIPMCIGIAVGRIGCFLTGLEDHTFGNPTSLPLGVDFGDGVPRHPTQLYEIVFVIVLAFALNFIFHARRDHADSRWQNGDVFKIFMVSYLAFRLTVDWLKPEVRIVLGLSSIQWVCILVLLYYATDVHRWLQGHRTLPALAPEQSGGEVEHISP